LRLEKIMENRIDQFVSEAKRIVKRVLPVDSVRSQLTQTYQRRMLEHGLRQLKRDPWSIFGPRAHVLNCLVRGWGNRSWAADSDFLTACIDECRATTGPILECGSGLSTIIVGAIAQAMSREVWTLEHLEDWGAKVTQHLDQTGVRSVHMCVKPLKDYGDFTWYDPPLDDMPGTFELVICDGPPGGVDGGRNGFLPVMKNRIAPHATILLDDTVREEEMAIAHRWAAILNGQLTFYGNNAFVTIRAQ
jgi:hypothetical protein